jgi:predicted phage-related endonuclease
MGSEELTKRRDSIGGSDANVILSGQPEKILRLWREKRGEIDPEDLSGLLRVALGNWTEAFNRQWYERVSGNEVGRVGETISCSKYDWRNCTIDGFVESVEAVWEAKHTSGFMNAEDLIERYMPQLQHNMAVAGVSRAILSVIYGNHKYEIIEIASDWIYQLELLEAEEDFWRCVESGTPPIPADPPPPPRPVGIREVCLEGNNAWAAAAVDWLQNREAARIHAAACGLIKGLIEEDVARAFGHGIEAKRNKSGAITIRELV